MIQVFKIDEKGFYTFETYPVEEPNEFEITTPVNTCQENTFYKPKWNGVKWVEGATQIEIDEINKPALVEPPVDEMEVLRSQLAELSEYTLLIEMKNIELEEQTTLNSEYVLDLDTRLIMLENKQI